MSYQEKRSITNIVTGALVLTAYCVYAFGQYQSGMAAAHDLKFWAIIMLKFIAVGVVATIIIQIVFHILLSVGVAVRKTIQEGQADDKEIEKEIEAEMVEDEMDKLIELKSTKFGFAIAGVGFVAALVSLAFDYPPMVMLNILFISMSVGSLLEGFAQLYFYRKGV